MADIYDGTEGDDALAAGLDIMDGTEDWRDGWKSVNKTRDMIARVRAWVTDTIAALWPLSVVKGGTGASTAAGALANLGAWQNNGAVADGQSPTLGWNGARLQYSVPGYAGPTNLANLSDIGAGYLPLTGGTVTGDINVPNAHPASSGYTVAYINGDGRIARGASSERYKHDIHQIDPSSIGSIFPDLYSYRMNGDDTPRVGWIAERLAEHPDLLPFVVYARYVTETGVTIVTDQDGNPVPDSIDFIALLIAQNAQLNARLTALETRA